MENVLPGGAPIDGEMTPTNNTIRIRVIREIRGSPETERNNEPTNNTNHTNMNRTYRITIRIRVKFMTFVGNTEIERNNYHVRAYSEGGELQDHRCLF